MLILTGYHSLLHDNQKLDIITQSKFLTFSEINLRLLLYKEAYHMGITLIMSNGCVIISTFAIDMASISMIKAHFLPLLKNSKKKSRQLLYS